MSYAAALKRADLTLVLDLCERVFLLILFAHLCYRFFESIVETYSIAHSLILMVELSVVLFVVFRSPTKDISRIPSDWLISLLATCAPLLIVPSTVAPVVSGAVCIGMMVTGVGLQLSAKVALNTRFGVLPANRGVMQRGPYAFLRHPMYFGYTLTHIGFLLYAPCQRNLIVYVAGFALQVIRILREERLLSADPAYRKYAEEVPSRIVPGVF